MFQAAANGTVHIKAGWAQSPRQPCATCSTWIRQEGLTSHVCFRHKINNLFLLCNQIPHARKEPPTVVSSRCRPSLFLLSGKPEKWPSSLILQGIAFSFQLTSSASPWKWQSSTIKLLISFPSFEYFFLCYFCLWKPNAWEKDLILSSFNQIPVNYTCTICCHLMLCPVLCVPSVAKPALRTKNLTHYDASQVGSANKYLHWRLTILYLHQRAIYRLLFCRSLRYWRLSWW